MLSGQMASLYTSATFLENGPGPWSRRNEQGADLQGGPMSDAKEAKVPVGTTTKTGQYLEEPNRLTWTTQKPTAPGLYGYRRSRDGKAYMVEVELDGETLKVDDKSIEHCRGPVATIEGEWAGPMLPPK